MPASWRSPTSVADDLFLDGLFSADERVRVPDVTTTVATPLRTPDLLARLVRVRRGNATLRRTGGGLGVAVRPADRMSWLRDVVVVRPSLAPAAVVYVAITAWSALLARLRPTKPWGRDESSRAALAG